MVIIQARQSLLLPTPQQSKGSKLDEKAIRGRHTDSNKKNLQQGVDTGKAMEGGNTEGKI